MKKTLVILAAGMGSRFGGLKQLQSVGPNGEYIIDYSVYDAVKVGFDKVVFVIKEENYEVFRNTIGKRIEKHVLTEYAFQKNDIIKREKPLGTAHAIYSAREAIHEPFMVINADDFYGRDAYKKGVDFLESGLKGDVYGLISYKLRNTLSDNGEVKRGVCLEEDGYLRRLTESIIKKEDGKIKIIPFDDELSPYISDGNEKVSMNMLVFNTSVFGYIEEKIPIYIDKASDKENFELLIPDIINDGITEGKFKFCVIETDSVWQGMTYREDLGGVKKYIEKQIRDGIYPDDLWD